MERRREEALQKLEDRRQAAEARALERQQLEYEEATATLPVPDPAVTQRTRRREPEPVAETLPWEDGRRQNLCLP